MISKKIAGFLLFAATAFGLGALIGLMLKPATAAPLGPVYPGARLLMHSDTLVTDGFPTRVSVYRTAVPVSKIARFYRKVWAGKTYQLTPGTPDSDRYILVGATDPLGGIHYTATIMREKRKMTRVLLAAVRIEGEHETGPNPLPEDRRAFGLFNMAEAHHSGPMEAIRYITLRKLKGALKFLLTGMKARGWRLTFYNGDGTAKLVQFSRGSRTCQLTLVYNEKYGATVVNAVIARRDMIGL